MGQTIFYAMKQWDACTRFISYTRLPLGNNGSEVALRKATLDRKNFLFVGPEVTGKNLVGTHSLIAS